MSGRVTSHHGTLRLQQFRMSWIERKEFLSCPVFGRSSESACVTVELGALVHRDFPRGMIDSFQALRLH